MKAVITCGGTGTRLLPFTKELPKEMAPVFIKRDSCLQTIPLIQLIFENLYEEGIREFCFITGKTKRAIENHFTAESDVRNNDLMSSFYKKLENTKMIFGRKITYAKKIPEALKNCECAIIMTPWNDYSKLTSKDFRKMKKRVIIDSRRLLANKKLNASYYALGIGS